MDMPGFTAEASLGRTGAPYAGMAAFGGVPARGIGGVQPQLLRFGGDPDLGEYLRCIANGGGDLVCRFFGGLPPFTIGGLLIG
jgi:hypothetical protein